MKKKDSKRWLLLIIAFIVACMIWYMVVSRENPKVHISLGNVSVTLRGGSGLHDKGYGYFVEDYESIGVEADVPQKKAVLVDSDDFLLTADISECTEGENVVTVDSKVKENRSIIGNNYSLDHDSITIRLEKLVEKDIPVKIDVTGTTAEGTSYGDAISSDNTIKVRVPESMEDETLYAWASVDITGIDKTWSDSVLLQIIDGDGSILNEDALQILPEQNTVDVIVPVGKQADLSLHLPETGEYKVSGYCCTKIESDVEDINVIGPEESLEGLQDIYITASDLKLNIMQESYKKKVNLDKYLPDDVYVQDSDLKSIPVKITIQKMKEKTFTLKGKNVKVSGKSQKNVSIDTKQFQITLGSSDSVIKSLQAEDIHASVDISGLDSGTYTLSPDITFDDEEERIELYNVDKITVVVSGS